jgi:hypothetical protein
LFPLTHDVISCETRRVRGKSGNGRSSKVISKIVERVRGVTKYAAIFNASFIATNESVIKVRLMDLLILF